VPTAHILVWCRSPRSGRPLAAVLPAGHPARSPDDDAPARWDVSAVALTAAGLACTVIAAGAALAFLGAAATTLATAAAALLVGARWVQLAARAADRRTPAHTAPVRGPAPVRGAGARARHAVIRGIPLGNPRGPVGAAAAC
jgi:hypothetical protein